jgi:hypothetical protein
MAESLKEFFAVTRTSVYHVQAHEPWVASATKIALKGESKVAVGTDIAEGGMIAIGKTLQGYIPEKYGMSHPMTGYERDPMLINTRYWGWHSSGIIALFKDKEAAMACFGEKEHKLCDPRWLESTKQVLSEIGDEHPSFFVHHNNEYDLLQSKQAA